jgi:hypothetical protein
VYSFGSAHERGTPEARTTRVASLSLATCASNPDLWVLLRSVSRRGRLDKTSCLARAVVVCPAMRRIVFLLIVTAALSGLGARAEELGPVRATGGAPPARLRVSDNRRFLVRADGRAFFWLGDTAWELFHRLSREQAEHYLKDRASKGYTVIQAVVLAELDGQKIPNRYGQRPLVDDDPLQPNPAYFQHVDWIVARANALGLVIAMLPTWGNRWYGGRDGPPRFNEDNAARYGEWLGRRYKDADLVWVLGGDRPVESALHRKITVALAKGLRSGDAGQHLITFHPTGGQGSAQYFHDQDWLDFNMRQNGHSAEYDNYAGTHADYDRKPPKPVLDGEPLYEDHPISFQAERFGHSLAADVRRPLYWDLFGGAFGHTYGNHAVWQMWDKDRPPLNDPLMYWTDAIAQPGARQMQHARWLLESRPFLTRVPDDSIIVPSRVSTSVPGRGRYRFVATRDGERSYAMIYAPVGRPFTVKLDALNAQRLKAWWFDPRTGKALDAGSYLGSGDHTFMPPSPGEDSDWVLVLDDVAKKYPPPGTRARSAGKTQAP